MIHNPLTKYNRCNEAKQTAELGQLCGDARFVNKWLDVAASRMPVDRPTATRIHIQLEREDVASFPSTGSHILWRRI